MGIAKTPGHAGKGKRRAQSFRPGLGSGYNGSMTSSHGDHLRSSLGKPRRFQFRLIHLFYAVTVFCSALVVFEPVLGCLVGASTVWMWAAVLANRRPPTVVETLVIGGITMVLISLTFPAVGTYPPPSAGGRICSGNLSRIGIALQNYHGRYGSFPPAFGGDDGRPKHSWRVLILPFLGEQDLYDAYDFCEPWNGPRNQQLAARMPDVFRCPGEDRETRRSPGDRTRYLAVVGPHAAWLGSAGRRASDFVDGPSETVMVLEAGVPGVIWLEPCDLTDDQAQHLLGVFNPEVAGGHQGEEFFYTQFIGRYGLMADGSTLLLGYGVPEATATALLHIDDGTLRPFRHIRGVHEAPKRYKFRSLAGLVLFVCLVLLPLPYVRRS
jgi:hypothetical protein